MHALEVIVVKNAAAAGREAGEVALKGSNAEHATMEKNQDEAVFEQDDKGVRSAMQKAYHEAFLRELRVRP